tara:strand:- start:205 stop:993 length:789 start_codon:yes stop_codon:yes gene_type:complete
VKCFVLVSVIKITLILSLTIILLIPQIFFTYAVKSASHVIPLFYHRILCLIIGIKIEIRGKPSFAERTLYVSNHCSYLDIVVLGSILPACFISKSEVSAWPFFGLLARLQRTIFIDRKAIKSTVEQVDVLSKRLLSGDSLILFPEGSSTDGTEVLPFKSSLFYIVSKESKNLGNFIQPITLAYTHVNEKRIDQKTRSKICWFGDATLLNHLWNFLGTLSSNVIVTFHDPVNKNIFKDRKDITIFCHKRISTLLKRINSNLVP